MLSFGSALTLFLLLSVPLIQSGQAVQDIDYGRSWPRSIAVDPARHVVFVDGASGIYPPTGFSFGVINSSSETLDSVYPLPVPAGNLAMDGQSGVVYVAGNDSIAVFDSGSMSFVRVVHLEVPVFSLAFDGSTGYLLLTSGDSILQLDPATGRLLRNATVGESAQGIAVDPARGKVFVAGYLSHSVSVLRGADLSPIATVALGSTSFPSRLALDPLRGVLYATTDSKSVAEVNASSDEVLRSLPVTPSDMNGTYGVAVDASRGRLFVVGEPGESVVELDATSGSMISTFSLNSAAFELALDQSTGRLYVSDYHQVTVIDPSLLSQPGIRPSSAGPLAVLIGAALAVILALYAWRTMPIGGRRDGSRLQPRRGLSLIPCSGRRLLAPRGQ